jgi:CHASE2 domain-containing sensor protein
MVRPLITSSAAWLARGGLELLGAARSWWCGLRFPGDHARLGLLIALFVTVDLALLSFAWIARWDRATLILLAAVGIAVNVQLFVIATRDRRWSAKIIVGMLVSFFLFVVNLFGYRTALDHYGEQLFAPLAASRPFGPYGVDGEGSRQHTVVVLLRDQDLHGLAQPWPMPYGEHARILGEIRKAGPRAVLIDFLFVEHLRKDETLGQLADELRAYEAAKIPLFLAAPKEPTLTVLRELQDHAQLVPVPRYVDEQIHNLYPFFACAWRLRERPKDCDGWHRTAAAEIYLQVCTIAKSPMCGPRVLVIDAALEKEELALVWGRKAPDRSTIGATGCASEASHALQDDCPFTPTVPVNRLMPRTDAPPVAAAIRDRVVFYGARVEAASDLTRPPLQPPLASVYAHAMAFDNLLTYGEHYKRKVDRELPIFGYPKHFELTGVAQGVILMTAPILCLWPALKLREWLERPRRSPWRAWSISLLVYMALALVYVLAVALYEFRWLNVIPGNWLESVVEVVVGVAAADLFTPQLEKTIEKVLGEPSAQDAGG